MKTALIILAFVAGLLCSGCATTREMPNSQKLEYKATGETKAYHNDSHKDYTGIELSMAFTQQW